MMIMDQLSHTEILYSDGEVICMIIGKMIFIMIIYGEVRVIITMDGITEIQSLIDSDHVQLIIMSLVKKSGMIC